jgi:hypothetical protein
MRNTLSLVATLALSTPVFAQTPTPVPASVPMPGTPTPPAPTDQPVPTAPTTTAAAPDAEVKETSAPDDDRGGDRKKEPERGDFDAGGQLRLPAGPDDEGKYATFNWVAVDLKGKYYLLKWVTVDGTIPLAVKKPDMAFGTEPSMIGGITTRLEAKTPPIKLPFMKQKSEVGVAVGLGYMREGAMLLNERDVPLYAGDFQPGTTLGVISRVKLGKIVDFNFNPQWVFQKGEAENRQAVQIPLSLVVSAGDVLELGTELGVYTGDDYSFGAADGGRIATGVSLDIKIGKLVTHAGVGFASLLTDEMGMYPTIKESMYIDLNVKYAK